MGVVFVDLVGKRGGVNGFGGRSRLCLSAVKPMSHPLHTHLKLRGKGWPVVVGSTQHGLPSAAEVCVRPKSENGRRHG